MKKLPSVKPLGALYLVNVIVQVLYALAVIVALVGFTDSFIHQDPNAESDEQLGKALVAVLIGIPTLVGYAILGGICIIIFLVVAVKLLTANKDKPQKTGIITLAIVFAFIHVLAYIVVAFAMFVFFENILFFVLCFVPLLLLLFTIPFSLYVRGNVIKTNQRMPRQA